jgi:hypothetical protein
MTQREHRRESERELLNTASWIYATTGQSFDDCINAAGELLAALSEGEAKCE